MKSRATAHVGGMCLVKKSLQLLDPAALLIATQLTEKTTWEREALLLKSPLFWQPPLWKYSFQHWYDSISDSIKHTHGHRHGYTKIHIFVLSLMSHSRIINLKK